MKPNTTNRTVVSTVGGEAVGMAIAAGAEKHLMGLLTNLYEDPEKACIREYATNGYDSHIEAGVQRAIEVGLPTAMRPSLTIRDYGVGLDEDDIRRIYSQYGASTKRDTNDAVGTFGLGCKSALAYADQFTLTAWKHGKRMSVSVSRDEHGAGVMTILEPPAPSDGETGVEVTIPARRGNAMAEKAEEFFRFWPEGTVLVDGAEPKRPELFRLNDDMAILNEVDRSRHPSYYSYPDTTPIIVMGNVPYQHDLDFGSNRLPRGKRLIARVPIGSCDVAPAREGLMDTAHTRKTLEGVVERFKADRVMAAKKELAKATDRADAVKRAIAACESLGISNEGLEWQGEQVPVEVARKVKEGQDQRFWLVEEQRSTYSGRGENPAARMTSVRMATAIGCEAWVSGFSNATWSRTMREKLDHYIDAHHLTTKQSAANAAKRTYCLVPDATVPEAKWFGPTVVKWEDVKAWKDPARATGGGGNGGIKTAGTYPAYDLGGSWDRTFAASNINTAKTVLWTISRPGEAGYMRRRLTACEVKDFYLVELSNTRKAKFLRDFPMAQHAEDALVEARKKLADSVTQDEKDAAATCANDRTLRYEFPSLKHLPDDTDDVEWNRLLTLAKLHEKCESKLRTAGNPGGGNRHTLTAAAAKQRYPLISRYANSAKLKQHIKAYINVIHNEGGTA